MPVLFEPANLADAPVASIIDNTDTVIHAEAGYGTRFPLVYPYPLVIEEKNSSGIVIKREIASCTLRVDDDFTVTRASEACPSSDSDANQSQVALQFDNPNNTTISLVFTAKNAKDLRDAVDGKLGKSALRNTMGNTNVSDSEFDVSGAELLRPRTAGSTILSTELSTFIDPSTRARKEIPYSTLKNDFGSAGKYIQTAQMGEALGSAGYASSVVNTFATSGSNAGTYTTMGGRLQFGNRTKIVSAKYPHNASNGSASIVITDVVGTVLGTYPVANGTKEATGINFVCEPGVIYQIGCNSTVNFGSLHANFTLTQTEIDKGFISGCYGNANFDTTWRMQEVVTQDEIPANYAVSVVGMIKYVGVITVASGSAVKRGMRIQIPTGTTLRTVVSAKNSSSSSATIQLRDESDALIKEVAVASGQNSADMNWVSTGAIVRLVQNDSANFNSSNDNFTIANAKAFFPYLISGTTNNVTDNSNAFAFNQIDIDFMGRAYKARGNKAMEFEFNKISGFVSGPKSYLDTVTLNATEYSVIDGFTGLIPGTNYYISSIGGIITSTPSTTGAYRIGYAKSTTSLILIPSYNTTDATYVLSGSVSNASYPTAGVSRHIFKSYKKGVVQFVTNAGVPGGALGYGIINGIYKNGVYVTGGQSNGASTTVSVVPGDVLWFEATAGYLGGDGSLIGGSVTVNFQEDYPKALSLTL